MSLITKFTTMSAIKQATLVLCLAICIVFGIETSISVLTEKPQMQLLVTSLSVADAPKVIDVFNENKISYRINPPDNMLYVSKAQSDEARVVLASVGVVVDIPSVSEKL
jgi:flagellar biosynthesis/type III secretory pathway M-ring protein FliF/YscJ